MRKYFTEDITLELLIRYVEGTADQASAALIENWIKADVQNRKLLDRIKDIWSHPEDLAVLSSELIEQDWIRIRKQISLYNKDLRHIDPSGDKGKRKWFRIAAAFAALVIMGSIVFVWRNISRAEKSQVVYNEIFVPNGQKSDLLLSDGTRIMVNAGSKVRFPNDFQGKKREIWLDGEAYFDVTKNAEKPFYVYTKDLTIKVLGTTFDVEAYPQDGFTRTTLIDGQVKIWQKDTNPDGRGAVIMKPNDQAIYISDQHAAIYGGFGKNMTQPLIAGKIIVTEPDKVQSAVSWTEGKLSFENEPFAVIAKKLERRYGVEIVIQEEDLRQIRFTGVLKNISVEQALKALQITADFRITFKDETLYIHH